MIPSEVTAASMISVVVGSIKRTDVCVDDGIRLLVTALFVCGTETAA